MVLYYFWCMAFLLVLLLAYVLLLIYYAVGWQRAAKTAGAGEEPDVSIIIAARNEAAQMHALITALLHQQYGGRVEVIVADDHSTDDTAHIAAAAGARVVVMHQYAPPAHGAYKKHALEKAIAVAKYPWIVTMDADSTAGPDWLRALLGKASAAHQMVVGPVAMQGKRSFVAAFQWWDMLGMQLFTGGAIGHGHPFLANGTNLAFRKAAFDEVAGYQGLHEVPSGDDVLLLLKFKQVLGAESITYAASADALVHTAVQPTWRMLWHQRLRWASKTGKMTTTASSFLMVLAFIFHLHLSLGMLFFIPLLYARPDYALLLGLSWIVKLIVEPLMLLPMVRCWLLRPPWRWLLPSQILYPFYVVLVGILGRFIPYRWKGRRIPPWNGTTSNLT